MKKSFLNLWKWNCRAMASSSVWSRDTLAVVTGANKGIGLEIVKQMSLKGLTVVLTARDRQRGLDALSKVRSELGLSSDNLIFHPLDVCSSDSVSSFSAWINEKYGGLDILVNNAGVLNNGSTYENAKLVMETNYHGVKRVTKALLPYMRASSMGSRIINVSSELGQLQIVSPSLRQEMENPKHLTEERIDLYVNRFLQDFCEGNARFKGWPSGEYAVYSMSKLAVNAYTRVLARELHKTYVNCMHPGYVKTDMTKHQGYLSPKKGADTAVWLALHPPPLPSGKFFYQRKPFSF